MTQKDKAIEIPFGAKDSELLEWVYFIPEGMEAEIKDRKVIIKKAESEDERIRKELINYILYKADGVSEEQEHSWIAYLEKQKDIEDRWIEDREQCFWNGVEEGKMLAEKQKENPKSADSIPSDRTSDAKCEDRWHKVGDSLPDNPREVLCKDAAGNYFIGRYYSDEGWEISNYDDEDKPNDLNPPVAMWIDFPSEKQKEQKPAEWSEEDERMLRTIISDGSRGVELDSKQISWLKSLRRFWKPSEEQDYSGLSDLERGIHRGFLCAGVENVPVAIIKETAKECLELAKKQLLSYADESNPAIEAMADLERTFECNPDKLPGWLKDELAKKHLEGYIMGRERTMREMRDFIESHFNCEKAREGTYYKDYERNPDPIPTGIPYQSPQCGTNVTIVPNINSGTSTSKADG